MTSVLPPDQQRVVGFPNLRKNDFSKMPDFKERSSKGGSHGGPKKQWAARLRVLKKRGMNDETYQKMYAIMTERESFAMDNYFYLQKWLGECTSVQEKVMIGRLMNEVMKFLHPEPKSVVAIQNNNSTEVKINIIEYGATTESDD
jgi:hypothetical protein